MSKHRRPGHTLAEARDILRKLGISIKKTEHGEYRVAPSKAAHPDLSLKRIEDMATYDNDLESAVGTGKSMAAHLVK